MQQTSAGGVDLDEATGQPQPEENEYDRYSAWVKLAKDVFQASDSWFDMNIRPQLERNLANFQSRHPGDSKYHTDVYSHRNRGFRPKTRSMVRRGEAATAKAFFATADALSVKAENDNDRNQQASAEIAKELVNYSLERRLPWFLICMGAYQDSKVMPLCCSHQSWFYREGRDGQKIADRPDIRVIPIENMRFDPGADWTNIAETSPYLVELLPMYLSDVRDRIRAVDPKTGEPDWFDLPDSKLTSARRQEFDSTRQARHPHQTDPLSESVLQRPDQYQLVWVHRYIVHLEGEDWLFYTVGTECMLSRPVRLAEAYPHLRPGERPYIIGFSSIDAHRPYPQSSVELVQDMQSEMNDIANQRRDNVQLVLNKRYLIKREASIDTFALRRSVPGGAVETNDPNTDVVPLEYNDVTGSAYEEQDRLNVDFDELAGTFSSSSVASNRKLNETVGGMNLLTDDANEVREYEVRIFAETWVEPVMRQLVRLHQYYENDAVVLAIAGERAQLWQKFNVNTITDELLEQELTVRVNVGLGSTNPRQRVEQFLYGMSAIGQLNPMILQKIKGEEVVAEVFGALGYRDGKRFFENLNEESPMVQQLQQQLQELQRVVETKQIEGQTRLQVAQINSQTQLEIAYIKAKLESIDKELEREKNVIARGELLLQKRALLYQLIDKQINTEMDMARMSNEREDATNARSDAERDRAIAGGGNGRKPNPTGSKPKVISNDQYGNLPHGMH